MKYFPPLKGEVAASAVGGVSPINYNFTADLQLGHTAFNKALPDPGLVSPCDRLGHTAFN